jgi:NAD(P)-dependent dehydrogenase (short-subunit alcohol dehydrogenase family)
MTANETLNGTHNGVQNGISNIAQDTATENPQPTTSVQLQGKVIAITGANRGIGLGIANSCLNNGAAHVYSIDIGDTGDDFLAVAKRFPGQLHALKADVTNEDTVTAAVDRIIEEVGAIHGFVANAGQSTSRHWTSPRRKSTSSGRSTYMARSSALV